MAEPTAAAAGQAHSGQRNVQFRVSASQQQQLQQHHHHNNHGSANSQSAEPSFPQQRPNAAPSVSQSQSQSHSTQYTHFGSTQQPQQHPQHPQHQQQQHQQQHQQHQQRPPIPPAHQPRLHHSISAGNIAMVASASRFAPAHGGAGGTGPNATLATTQPKKKDPYATAWRTYSKIAEELQLLNPDGTLYPISKEAILKYLHHQSKRIKSSNLHWYVNGLKKHQENLGFPWDDVRYDEQVVSLLKELTLHPVMAAEHGDDDGHGGHAYGAGPQAGRQRQSSAGTAYPLGKSGGTGGHHYSSSSIDTTRIANLSISQQPPPPPPANHSQQQQQQQQHQQQQQQRTHGSSYGTSAGLKQQHQNHQLYLQQHQQMYQQSQRIQQPPPPKPHYHSAPIQVPPSQHSRTPSAQDFPYQSGPSHYHPQVYGGANQSGEAIGQRPDPPGTFTNALAKRKRNELEFRKRRVTEGEDKEDDDLRDEGLRNDDDDLDGRGGHDMDDLDYMEDDPNRYQPLKRRASTGTLLSQARASAVKHIPGPFATDAHRSGTHAAHPKTAYGEGLSGNLRRHIDDQQHLRSPSPDLRDDDLTGHYSRDSRREGHRARDSPPDSISSASSAGASQLGQILDAEARRHRHLSGGGSGGGNGLARSSSAASASSPTGAAMGTTASGGAGKTTVHFSEVVECAQRLQTRYGDRCKDHPWGCVEIPGEQHLELTIKMYLDWAGLVASHRLTMDDLPDLPEFRRIQPVVVGGTLRRMASTPLTSSLFNASAGSSFAGAERNALLNSGSSTLSMNRHHHATADDGILTGSGSSRVALFGAYRSPSSSPPNHHHHHEQQEPQQDKEILDNSEEKPTLVSRMGSPPPLPIGSAAQQQRRTSPMQGLLHRGARKMPSTPILRQQQHPSSGSGGGGDRALLTRQLHRHPSGSGAPLPSSHHRGHPHRGSIISNSTASSPASEVEDMSDEDDLLERDGKTSARRAYPTDDEEEGEDEEEEEEEEEEDEDEDIDVSHYALSPWAAVKITTTTIRSGTGAPGLAKPSLRDQIQESRGVTPTMKAGPMEAMDGEAGYDKAMMGDGSAMAVDSECVVSEIGEIAEVREDGATGVDQDRKDGATGVDQDRKDGRGITTYTTTHCGVDATAQVLDSMILGRSDAGALGDGKTQGGVVVVETHAVAAAAVATAIAAVAAKEEVEEEADGLASDRGLDPCREHMYDGRAMDVEDSAMIES
ncbi:hypothetical protein BGZ70_002036 [Mortierella alpina]|uniref:Uncharacterized protein n=1 Tax=Mortierella alpina TaxID=64518 RepID=A0A9P6JDQ2_MORAP|nr:hypothetical protein BGZ70_002036 [Mortierella alpina]